ncbi:hypothetical protein [Microvirga sp. P5_D2]
MKVRVNGFGALLVVLLIPVNLGGLFYLIMEILTTSGYSGSNRGSYSMAEAAYLGSLWTAVVAKASAGILLNVVVFGWVILNLELHDPGYSTFHKEIVSEVKSLREKAPQATAPVTPTESGPIQPLAPV